MSIARWPIPTSSAATATRIRSVAAAKSPGSSVDDGTSRALGVDQQVGIAERAAPLPGGDVRQPSLLLLVGAGTLEHQPGTGVGEERQRRAGVAELLAEDDQLDHPEPLAAVLLGDRDARPAELGDLGPEGVVVAVAFGELADDGGSESRGEELPRGLLDLRLLVVEVESHALSYRSRGRPSTRSATMFFITSVVPPSIELARLRSIR
jgi:hypothetical protein